MNRTERARSLHRLRWLLKWMWTVVLWSAVAHPEMLSYLLPSVLYTTWECYRKGYLR